MHFPHSLTFNKLLSSQQRIVSNRGTVMMGTKDINNDDTSTQTFSYETHQLHQRHHQQRDVVIVGGALAGLSTALYLSQLDPYRHITILDRESYGNGRRRTNEQQQQQQKQQVTHPVASYAAAGMLAPQSERLPSGHLLDLCVSSRNMYPHFCDMVESFAKESGCEGEQYLYDHEFLSNDNEQTKDLDPYSVGYVATGGFLAPAFAGDAVATWAPPEEGGSAVWLDTIQVRELEPTLHPDVIGGWWFPNDASVDARRLTCSLRAACIAVGVQFLTGPQYEVSSLDLMNGVCKGVWLQQTSKKSSNGPRYIGAKTVLIANGAWMRQLLPVPIESHKGQSVALRMPTDRPPILRRVIFAQDTYIVPKADGRIVIGATVEAGKYDGDVTPMGLLHILTHAIQMIPALKDLPIEESWAGLRPTTPDKGPILGKTPWNNLFIAGGYWRNGVLLAPKTGQLLASLIVATTSSSTGSDNGFSKHELSEQDEEFLNVFAWDRFTNSEKSGTVTANARFAAAMHPIHARSSIGVSAAVGTELGSYSSARAATNERQRDRETLWTTNNDADASFERAAELGKQDALAYSYSDDNNEDADDPWIVPVLDASRNKSSTETSYYMDGAADALTVGSSDLLDDDDDDEKKENTDTAQKDNSASPVKLTYEPISENTPAEIKSIYETIQANKAKQQVVFAEPTLDESKPDPGFRIYHIDEVTGEEREIPPYTSPGEFLASIEANRKIKDSDTSSTKRPKTSAQQTDYDETTYDGYQEIQKSNARNYRQDELDVMREARRKNRLGQNEIDLTKIGVQNMFD
jgi:glycine oxidase